jgi:DNA-binding transcriptional regulator YiaG/uncharacterized phage-associated protein
MKSPFTGKDMILVREKRTQTFRKEEFKITHHSFRCVDTEEQFTNTELDVLNLTQLYNQYREKHKIPFPEQIKQIREKYKVSAAKMADILGFGVNSYRLYEDGEIPSLSNARLIQSVDEPDVFKQMVNLCDKLDKNEQSKIYKKIEIAKDKEQASFNETIFQNHLVGDLKPSIKTGYKVPNIEKLTAMVLFFSEKLKPFKTKLNKLLFYSDFQHFKTTGFSISGISYRAIDMGPVPNNFQSLFEQVQQQGEVEIIYQFFDNDVVGEQFVSKTNFRKEHFTTEELETLDKVKSRFEEVKTKEIIELSHQEKAWIDNEKNKTIISYDSAFDLKNI